MWDYIVSGFPFGILFCMDLKQSWVWIVIQGLGKSNTFIINSSCFLFDLCFVLHFCTYHFNVFVFQQFISWISIWLLICFEFMYKPFQCFYISAIVIIFKHFLGVLSHFKTKQKCSQKWNMARHKVVLVLQA